MLVALTPETTDALGGHEARITTFPYRVGRESRTRWPGRSVLSERRSSDSKRSNELYLPDVGEVLNVSRDHLQFERDGDDVMLVDRGSTCGTIVEGTVIGGQGRGGSVALKDGDVIIVGTSLSPFAFKVRLG